MHLAGRDAHYAGQVSHPSSYKNSQREAAEGKLKPAKPSMALQEAFLVLALGHVALMARTLLTRKLWPKESKRNFFSKPIFFLIVSAASCAACLAICFMPR